jgi:hypothetical protein
MLTLTPGIDDGGNADENRPGGDGGKSGESSTASDAAAGELAAASEAAIGALALKVTVGPNAALRSGGELGRMSETAISAVASISAVGWAVGLGVNSEVAAGGEVSSKVAVGSTNAVAAASSLGSKSGESPAAVWRQCDDGRMRSDGVSPSERDRSLSVKEPDAGSESLGSATFDFRCPNDSSNAFETAAASDGDKSAEGGKRSEPLKAGLALAASDG